MLLEATRWRRLLGGQRGGNGPEGGARQSSNFKRISREAAVQGKVKLYLIEVWSKSLFGIINSKHVLLPTEIKVFCVMMR